MWTAENVENYLHRKRQHLLANLNAESAQFHLLIKRQERYKKGRLSLRVVTCYTLNMLNNSWSQSCGSGSI